jgi:hypothetical protein
MLWKCKNQTCTENDIHNLVNDRENGDIICTSCGVVQDMSLDDVYSLGSHGAGHGVSLSVVPGYNFKDSYVRFVHFMERFAAHDRADPIVPEADMDIIRAHHTKFMEKDYFYRERVNKGIINKKDIQKLLRFIDGNQRQKSWRGVSKISKGKLNDKKKNAKMAFSRLYLERWTSIIADLTGIENEQYDPVEMTRIMYFMEMFSNLWNSWQPPRHKFDPEKKNWRYKHRKHFPNINFVFQKVHQMLNLQRFNKDFPLPTTTNSMKQLKVYWKDMCKELVTKKRLDPAWLEPSDLPEKYKQVTLDDFIHGNHSSATAAKNLENTLPSSA